MTLASLFTFRTDGAGLFLFALFALLTALTCLYAFPYFGKSPRKGLFFGFTAATLAALLGLCMAGNLLTVYLFFELVTLCSFPLVLCEGTKEARGAALKYLGFSVFGAGLALAGLALLGPDSAAPFATGGTLSADTARMRWAYFLLMLGFGAKAGLLPLSNWLPTAHPAAPAPASALLSGVITKAGIIGMLRTSLELFIPASVRGSLAHTALLVLALVTVFAGSMLALLEQRIKKRLAFSSVSQLGYIVLGLLLYNQAGLSGALMQLVFHALVKTGLFLAAGAMMHETGAVLVSELNGVGRRMPATLSCFTLLSLSLVGIPPMGGFCAKWALLCGARDYGGAMGEAAMLVLLLSALLTAGYLLSIVSRGFFPGEAVASKRRETPRGMLLPLVLLSALALAGGLFSGVLERALAALYAAGFGGVL